MITLKIIKTPKMAAPFKEWVNFAATAPRDVILKAYYKAIKSAKTKNDVLQLLEGRVKSFERGFACFRADSMFRCCIEVDAGVTHQQIKQRVSETKGALFPMLIVEKNNLIPHGGWFRGLAINKDLILGGVISDIKVNLEQAEQIVKNNNFCFLTASDVEALYESKLSAVTTLFKMLGTPIYQGEYWLDGYVGQENLVWQAGATNKFSCLSSEATVAGLIVKL